MKFGWGNFGLDPGRDRENLAAIATALGDDRALMIDPGWYVEDAGTPRVRSVPETRAMLHLLTELELEWVEDFVHPETPADYAAFKAEFPTLRFAAGEQHATRWDFHRLIHEGGVDVLQPDLSRCGGLTVARFLASDAEAMRRRVVTHSWLTDLLHAYSLHYLATLRRATWVEFNVAQSVLSQGVTTQRLALADDGTLAVPNGSGLGVEVDLGFVRARRVDCMGSL